MSKEKGGQKLQLSVVGAGHVGLVSGACFAELGNQVICVDKDSDKIDQLRKGIIPFYEPGLKELVLHNLEQGRLAFTDSIAKGVKTSTCIFIAVDTPTTPDGQADLSQVEAVARDLARAVQGYKVIVEKSTVPVKTGGWVKRTLKLYNNDADFDIASIPEFLRQGSAIEDFMHPDRIVIGLESKRAEELLRELFQPFAAPIVFTDLNSAELIKHASNSFLALKISYINAVAAICEQAGADVVKVAEGMGYDRRIGRAFLDAGIGYGGSCFPKDVCAFIRMAQEAGYDFQLLREVEKINREQRIRLIKKVKEALWILRGKTIGILGLSFKPNTDDMRGAPSIEIIKSLQTEGARIKAYDPAAMANAAEILSDIEFCRSPYQVAEGADALVILTEWEEFKKLDLPQIKGLLNIPVIIDGRNIYPPEQMRQMGFEYKGIGRA